MGQLIVRNIDDGIAERLKRGAAENGVSAEEEHRQILRHVLAPKSTQFKDFLLAIPEVGEDADFARMPQPQRDTDL
ncbi:MAG: plasmid stability protein [Rhodothermales bacterium]|jgi:plasmid stability protein